MAPSSASSSELMYVGMADSIDSDSGSGISVTVGTSSSSNFLCFPELALTPLFEERRVVIAG